MAEEFVGPPAPGRSGGGIGGLLGNIGGLGSLASMAQTILGMLGRRGREQREERAGNINTLNDFLAKMAVYKATSGNEPVDKYRQGIIDAYRMTVPALTGTGAPGSVEYAPGRSAVEAVPELAGIIASLRNPNTYSLTPNAGGGFDFNPQAPALASSTNERNSNTRFYQGGQAQYFGQAPTQPGQAPAPLPPPGQPVQIKDPNRPELGQ